MITQDAKPGVAVTHPRFGRGVIVKTYRDGNIAHVNFNYRALFVVTKDLRAA